MPGYHTSRDFESELRELRAHLLAMGARCERSVQLALKAFIEGSAELIAEVKSSTATSIATRWKATSWRYGSSPCASRSPTISVFWQPRSSWSPISSASATKRSTSPSGPKEAGEGPELVPHPHLRTMADLTQQMLRDALDAFVDADVARAERVRLGDDAVDELYGKTLSEMMSFMGQNPERISAAMGVINVAEVPRAHCRSRHQHRRRSHLHGRRATTSGTRASPAQRKTTS